MRSPGGRAVRACVRVTVAARCVAAERRVDEPGRDEVRAHAAARAFERDVTAQPDEAGLRRVVRGKAAAGLEAGDRPDEDDRAAFREHGKCFLGEQEVTAQVDGQGHVPIVGRRVARAPCRARCRRCTPCPTSHPRRPRWPRSRPPRSTSPTTTSASPPSPRISSAVSHADASVAVGAHDDGTPRVHSGSRSRARSPSARRAPGWAAFPRRRRARAHPPTIPSW